MLPLDLSVGEVARRSGVAVSAIHFYEAEGLIQGWRTAANHRRYPRGTLRRIAIIKVAQRAGIPLKEIGEALATLPKGAVPTRQGLGAAFGQLEERPRRPHRCG